jgi:formylglycine-generating enzyme required for sulfatase activity
MIENFIQMLEFEETAVQKRLQIGQQLAELGDPRPGVGTKEGVPAIAWLPVAPGGSLMLTRHWQPDYPGDTEKIKKIGPFTVTPFYISQYLVTDAQYQTFVAARDGYDQLTWWAGMPESYQQQPLARQQNPKPNYPRDSISWYQAVAFARWLSHRLHGFELPNPSGNGKLVVGVNAQIRLPTEGEWQWAAQNGTEERPFPWGETQPNFANTAETGLQQATAVGIFPHGAAACGALDMAGNLMEWCANNKMDPTIVDVASPANKVLRGGDWGYNLANAATNYCDDESPQVQDALNGFRLALGTT